MASRIKFEVKAGQTQYPFMEYSSKLPSSKIVKIDPSFDGTFCNGVFTLLCCERNGHEHQQNQHSAERLNWRQLCPIYLVSSGKRREHILRGN